MPYTASSSNLPGHVKKMSAKRRRQWVSVWNSTHKRTGSESRAFAAANSVAKKEMTEMGVVTLLRDDKAVKVTMYSGADDPDLPEHVKGLPLNLRSRWCNNYNWALQECMDNDEAQERADEYTSLSISDLLEMQTKEHATPGEPGGSAASVDTHPNTIPPNPLLVMPGSALPPAPVRKVPQHDATAGLPWHVRFRNWLAGGPVGSERVGNGGVPDSQAPAGTVRMFTVFKSDDGDMRFLAVYSNNFKDKEKQIISEFAHKEYAEAAETGQALYPDMHLWHGGPATRWGTVETVSYVGGFAVAGGVVDPGREHVAIKLKELADKGEIALSFGYYGLLGPDDVYYLYRPFEISPLPTGAEANPITGMDLALATKENGMAFSDKKKDWLKTHFKMDDAAIVAAEAAFEGMGNAIKAAGIEYKEAGESAAPPAPEPPPPPAPPPPAPEPAAPTPNPLADLANAVKGLSEQVATMQAEFKAFKGQDAAAVDRRAQEQILARVAASPGGYRPSSAPGNIVPGAKEAGDDWFNEAMGGVFNMEAMNAPAPTAQVPARTGEVR